MTELVIQIDNKALVPSLKKVILSLKGVKDAILTKKQSPAISPTAVRLLKDLSTFQSYKKGWDNAEACPLSQKVSKNFIQLLGKSAEEDLSDWNIFPEVNGTLMIENEKKDAQINLAEKEFSYFHDDHGQILGQNHIKFTVPALLKIIRQINRK
ncbi:MAG: hypothetical protein PUD15_02560 [Prevotella sp.]|uniref:hypothetical protein n=1 Tax=Prevotella sp. AGR2160 TaxID=1280674 RepID=UPI0004916D29|nr:hypothetical protein [Prevotella sp. AGR2160]MDD5861427.1 hypothetical protein [Prevotella sp.]